MGSGLEEYDDAACARWVDEPPKRPERTPFERDRARVVHSATLRRMAAKTQVVGPRTDDFVRNRLTHTLEVAQVARDLARILGCDADVVETAALAHDLGHPPFGHNGERALDDVSDVCGGFEGNAQTLRILTRLEAKSFTDDGRSAGLNLTRATLDASSKYPWRRESAVAGKFGVYNDDLEVFSWMRAGVPERARCIEAQVMDFADDVAYSVHDLEDGIVAGKIDLVLLDDPGRRREVWSTVRSWYLPEVGDDELDEAVDGLRAQTAWPTSTYDGSRPAQAALKNLTSDLIGLFCTRAEAATRADHGPGSLRRHAADLVVPREILLAIAALKGVAAHYVMSGADRDVLLGRQRELLTELVALLWERGPVELDPASRADFEAAPTDAGRLRVVIDQVASLTDASAVAWHARLA